MPDIHTYMLGQSESDAWNTLGSFTAKISHRYGIRWEALGYEEPGKRRYGEVTEFTFFFLFFFYLG